MEKNEIGFYTKILENGKIELFLSFGDGVGYFIKEFDSIIEVGEYIDEMLKED